MFTINLEDGREAPSKARKKGAKRLEFLVYTKQTSTVANHSSNICLFVSLILLFVCPIITKESLDRFASNFDLAN